MLSVEYITAANTQIVAFEQEKETYVNEARIASILGLRIHLSKEYSR